MKKFILIKCMDCCPSILGVFKTKDEARIAMMKDFENETIYMCQNKIRVKDTLLGLLIDDKLRNLNCKSECIFSHEQYEIDLDNGCAWLSTGNYNTRVFSSWNINGKDYNFDWKIINLEEI